MVIPLQVLCWEALIYAEGAILGMIFSYKCWDASGKSLTLRDLAV